MGGFRSPLFLLGLGAVAVVAQAGYRSPAAPWMGGASAPAAHVQCGYRSAMGLWFGGGCAVKGTPIPVPGVPSGNGTILAYLLDQKKNLRPAIQNDDEEVMDFVRIWVAWYSNQ